jgi:ubiquinone/menaquinone biosynthesis C-methylase UbiE
MTVKEDEIDVRSLLTELSVEELNQYAEEYFSRLTDWEYHLAKPFGALDEVPQLLINFAVVLQGLGVCPGMTVMELGAGTCWASRFLTQLGCRVIAVDVSPTALRIGQELYKRLPIIGERPSPRFLPFDGHRLEIPDASVDRIMCLDAFHHIPNSREVLGEMSRVLVSGGIAGFAEPGPQHSRSPQSQYEMKTFRVIENDVNIQDIWNDAQAAGFTDLKLAVFNVPPFHLSITEFENFLQGAEPRARYAEAASDFLQNQRNFFIYKGQPAASDSRYRAGLTGQISVPVDSLRVKEGETIKFQAVVTNSSPSIWLPRSAGTGAVHLGCHVLDEHGKLLRHSYHWEALTPGEGGLIFPNETVSFEVNAPTLPAGRYILELDLVSYEVCWFALNGSQQVRVALEVE